MEMRDCPVRLQPGIEGGQDVTLDTALLSHAGIAASVLTIHTVLQGVPQLSIHLVSVILPASTHPNFKSWGSFDKFRKFAT